MPLDWLISRISRVSQMTTNLKGWRFEVIPAERDIEANVEEITQPAADFPPLLEARQQHRQPTVAHRTRI